MPSSNQRPTTSQADPRREDERDGVEEGTVVPLIIASSDEAFGVCDLDGTYR